MQFELFIFTHKWSYILKVKHTLPKALTEDVKKAMAQLTQNFIDSSFERLTMLDQLIDDVYNERGNRGDLYQTLVNEVHSMKGTAGTYGFTLVTAICHHLEDYLESSRRLEKEQWLEVQLFIDEIRTIIESGNDPDEKKHSAILSQLPTSAEKAETIDAMVLIVMEAGVIRKALGTRLAEKGVDVSFAANSLEAVKRALALKPDLIAAGHQLSPITGIELANVLGVLDATKKIDFLLLTADKDLKIPKGMDVALKDRKVADHILNMLSHQKLSSR